jgi:hypothetical protein
MLTYAVLVVGFRCRHGERHVGTGATIILLPILVFAFGPREAVPIMAIVALMSNFAKITSWWKQIDWRACAAYALGGVPAAALGARTLLVLPERILDVALGLFFLAMVPGRRWLATRNITLGFGGLVVAGLVIGFLTGIVVSTGPLSVPLCRLQPGQGAFIATGRRLAGALHQQGPDLRSSAPSPRYRREGPDLGSSVMTRTYTARLIVKRLNVAAFQRLLDGVRLFQASACGQPSLVLCPETMTKSEIFSRWRLRLRSI